MRPIDYNKYLEELENLVDLIEDESCLKMTPLVSIVTSTFNHDKYIEETLESLLNQNTNFPYEIIVGDDCSTDKNISILLSYQKRYPQIIRLRIAKKNLRTLGYKNGKGIVNSCRGKYIAFCEGDDFWTNKNKLQKQVDFLNHHDEYSACAHTSDCVYMADDINSQIVTDEFKKKNTIDNDIDIRPFNLFSSYPFQTATFLMRRDKFEERKHFWNILNEGDVNLFIIMASMGKIRKFKEAMSVWRIHPGGVSGYHKNTNSESKKKLKTLKVGLVHLKGLMKLKRLFISELSQINRAINHVVFQYIDSSVNERKINYFFSFLFIYIKVNKIHQIRLDWILGSLKKILFEKKSNQL